MMPDENGQMQKYSAEWFNPSRLSKMNITKDTLKSGDYVIITGSPSRNVNERTLHLKRIQRPADGCCLVSGRPLASGAGKQPSCDDRHGSG